MFRIRRNGAAALDLAYVAAGRFDGFWEQNLSPWDMAAGIILVKEAGGILESIETNHNPLETGNIICSNNQETVFKNFLKLLELQSTRVSGCPKTVNFSLKIFFNFNQAVIIRDTVYFSTTLPLE